MASNAAAIGWANFLSTFANQVPGVLDKYNAQSEALRIRNKTEKEEAEAKAKQKLIDDNAASIFKTVQEMRLDDVPLAGGSVLNSFAGVPQETETPANGMTMAPLPQGMAAAPDSLPEGMSAEITRRSSSMPKSIPSGYPYDNSVLTSMVTPVQDRPQRNKSLAQKRYDYIIANAINPEVFQKVMGLASVNQKQIENEQQDYANDMSQYNSDLDRNLKVRGELSKQSFDVWKANKDWQMEQLKIKSASEREKREFEKNNLKELKEIRLSTENKKKALNTLLLQFGVAKPGSELQRSIAMALGPDFFSINKENSRFGKDKESIVLNQKAVTNELSAYDNQMAAIDEELTNLTGIVRQGRIAPDTNTYQEPNTSSVSPLDFKR